MKAEPAASRATGPRRRAIVDAAPLDPAKLRVLADPVRSFLLYSLVPRSKTVRELAAELDCPPTRLYYHLQQLEKHGLVFVASTRLVSGIVEKHYRAVARDWVLDRSGLDSRGPGGPRRLEALLAFVFDQSRQEIRRQVERGAIDLGRRAPQAGALLAVRNVLKLSDTQAERLYRRLHDFWQEYDAIAKEPAEGGRFYAFAVTLYPSAGTVVDSGRSNDNSRRRSAR